jgi:hypothetical protein
LNASAPSSRRSSASISSAQSCRADRCSSRLCRRGASTPCGARHAGASWKCPMQRIVCTGTRPSARGASQLGSEIGVPRARGTDWRGGAAFGSGR